MVWYEPLFIACVMFCISIANILLGCELDLRMVHETIKKPVAPCIGLLCQFVIMPLVAFGINFFMFSSVEMTPFALGLFITGCAPGGGASNFWTVILEGNANLSITMTFFSTVASFVMLPLWMNLLGYKFVSGHESSSLKVPYHKIIGSLFMMVSTLLIGVVLAKKKPNVAATCRKALRPFLLFVLIFLVIFGTLTHTYLFTYIGQRVCLAGLLLPWVGFTLGCISAVVTQQTWVDTIAIAIETGVQNTGVAIMVLKFSFAQPESDAGSLMPVLVACFTPIPLLACYGYGFCSKLFKKCKSDKSGIATDEIQTA